MQKKTCTVLKEWIPVMAGMKCEVLAEVLASAPWSSSPREEQCQSPHRLASVCARLGRRRGQGAWSAVRLPIGCVGTPCAQDRRASKDWGSHGWPQTSYNHCSSWWFFPPCEEPSRWPKLEKTASVDPGQWIVALTLWMCSTWLRSAGQWVFVSHAAGVQMGAWPLHLFAFVLFTFKPLE